MRHFDILRAAALSVTLLAPLASVACADEAGSGAAASSAEVAQAKSAIATDAGMAAAARGFGIYDQSDRDIDPMTGVLRPGAPGQSGS